ncbi:MAG: Gfo/Idh/MocA family oxidoreductase [Rhodospirillaceae bacterium]|nr:Gfo/Idh/MocA family oxidoreductase [Rhodospirillales bacterium]
MTNQIAPRVGIIGFGRMGARIALAALRGGMDVVAVLDSAPEPWGLGQVPDLAPRVTSDSDRFWAAPMDLLAVGTTADGHAPLVREGLRRGIKRFVVEKPFTQSVVEAETLIAEVAAAGGRISVNHGRRFLAGYYKLRELDGSDLVGSLRSITVVSGGGSTGCLGTHVFDLCNFMFGGAPLRVFAGLAPNDFTDPRGARFDDPGSYSVLEYAGGRRALLEMGGDTGLPSTMEFRFRHGRVVIEDESKPWRLFHRKPEDRALPCSRYGAPLIETVVENPGTLDIVEMSLGTLRDALSDGPQQAGGDIGLQTMQVFAAIRASAARGVVVALPVDDEAAATIYAIP